MELHRVKDGMFLHLPGGHPSKLNVGGRDRLWLKPGGVVDLEDPFVAEAIKGQEFKLERAAKGTKTADALPSGAMLRAREEFMAKWTNAPAAPTSKEQLELVGAAAGESVPTPDARPQKGKG
jgi:hypothetical protein